MKKNIKSCNEATVRDIIRACKDGVVSWEEVAKKALRILANSYQEDLEDLFDIPDDLIEEKFNLEKRIRNLENKLYK